MQIFIFAKV